jgi:hypothetical protein
VRHEHQGENCLQNPERDVHANLLRGMLIGIGLALGRTADGRIDMSCVGCPPVGAPKPNECCG